MYNSIDMQLDVLKNSTEKIEWIGYFNKCFIIPVKEIMSLSALACNNILITRLKAGLDINLRRGVIRLALYPTILSWLFNSIFLVKIIRLKIKYLFSQFHNNFLLGR